MLTLVDVSTAKMGRKLGEAIMELAAEPILILDERLEIVRSNHAFRQAFQVSAAETEGRFIVYDVGAGQSDSAKLRGRCWRDSSRRRTSRGSWSSVNSPAWVAGGRRIDGRRIESGEPGGGVILLIIRGGLPNRTDPARAAESIHRVLKANGTASAAPPLGCRENPRAGSARPWRPPRR